VAVDGNRKDATVFNASAAGMAGSLIPTNEDTSAFITALLDGRVVPRRAASRDDGHRRLDRRRRRLSLRRQTDAKPNAVTATMNVAIPSGCEPLRPPPAPLVAGRYFSDRQLHSLPSADSSHSSDRALPRGKETLPY
jgi:hypothetical protein